MATGAIGRIPIATKLDRLTTPTDTGFPTESTPNATDEMLMISVQMWELQYLSSSEKSLSKRTALKKRAITHRATTHVITVVLLSSGVAMGELSLGVFDAAALFFALVNVQLFITDAPWNSGWGGFGLASGHAGAAVGHRSAGMRLGAETDPWTTYRLVAGRARQDSVAVEFAETKREGCPVGFGMQYGDPLGVCSGDGNWTGHTCWRGGAVLLECPSLKKIKE